MNSHLNHGRFGKALGGRWVVVALVHAFLCRADAGEDPFRMRHASLGCSTHEADALYGPPEQVKFVPSTPGNVLREQRLYRSAQGRMVEVWFGDAGADAILLPGENGLEVIYQVLHDSAGKGTWKLDRRVWRHSDGQAVAAVMSQSAFVIGRAPWLASMVNREQTASE